MLYPAQPLPNHGTSITGSAQAALKRDMNTTQKAGHPLAPLSPPWLQQVKTVGDPGGAGGGTEKG